MSELESALELPDNTPIREVRFPTRIKDALFAAGIKTVGEVRNMADETLVGLPDLEASVVYLRETLGLSSTAGVRPPKNPRPPPALPQRLAGLVRHFCSGPYQHGRTKGSET